MKTYLVSSDYGNGSIEVKGKPVSFSVHKKYEFILHRGFCENGMKYKDWRVSELKSGSLVSKYPCKTKEDAIRTALENLKSDSYQKFAARVKRGIRLWEYWKKVRFKKLNQ